MKQKPLVLATTLILGLAASPTGFGVILGQIDTFEDGTTQDWLVGALGATHPAPPQNVASGGPGGADDNYLVIHSLGGGGPGSRLSVMNLSQWGGDYVAAGVGAIQMDLMNLGATDLDLRLLIANPVAGPPTDVAVSTLAVHLPAGSDWTRVLFPIGLTDLTLLGTGSLADALATATELRLFHNASPDFPPPVIVAELGVDNIHALVPEPAAIAHSLVLALSALGIVGWRRLRQP